MNMPLVLLNRRRRGGSFSPSTLFALAEPGVWFDPSDLTTLFTDPAGTTPVTTPGQTVGLMLDKSKGLALGADFVVNGSFTSGSNWVAHAGWSISNGVASSSAASAYLYQINASVVLNRYYEVTFTVSNYVSGSIRMYLGATPTLGTSVSANGTYTQRFAPTINGNELGFSGSTFTGSIDNVSVKEVLGNHATQATTASQPTYGIVPAGGRRNLLTFSEDFGNAVWVKERSSVAATTGGYLATVTGVSFSLLRQTVANTSGVPVVFTVIAKAGSATCIRIGLQNGSAGFDLAAGTATAGGSISDAGDGFFRCSVPYTGAAAQDAFIYLADVASNITPPAIGTSLIIRNAQLELGSTATAYQKVTTQHDVTEAGVASVSYLYFDGVNDAMATSTITPGTDKAQVFAGVRKLLDTTGHISGGDGNSPGQIEILSSGWSTNSSRYGAAFYTNSILIADSPANFAPPRTDVLSWRFDAAGATGSDRAKLRVNAADQALTTIGAPATANFLPHVTYLGARAGTSLLFTGHLYSLVVRFGANLDGTLISNTETWVAGKTGVTL